MPKNIL
jgi:hypothetical protein